MLNQVILGGKVLLLQTMADDYMLACLEVDIEKIYIFWNTKKLAFNFDKGDYIVVRGSLKNIQLHLNKSRNVVAVDIRSVEKYDF